MLGNAVSSSLKRDHLLACMPISGFNLLSLAQRWKISGERYPNPPPVRRMRQFTSVMQLPALPAAWGWSSEGPCRSRGRGGRWEVLPPEAYESREPERRVLPMSPPSGPTAVKQSSTGLLDGQRMMLRNDAPWNLLPPLSPHWGLSGDSQTLSQPVTMW